MVFKITSIKSRQAGFTLVEFLVAMGISAIVLAQVCLVWFYSSRSFAAQLGYVDMDRASQNALAIITKEIRSAKSLTSYKPYEIILKDVDDLPLTFRFETGQLVRIKGIQRKTILKDCTQGIFAIYQRHPMNGSFDYYPTSTPATCKLVEVRWTCARRFYPSAPICKESMQSAKIVIRTNQS